MNRNYLYTSLIFILIGGLLILFNSYFTIKLQSLLLGFGISLLIVGLVQFAKFLFYLIPTNKYKLSEKLENERIELHDELKEKVRGLAVRYTFIIELLFISLSIVCFSIFGALGLINGSRIFIIYLGFLLMFQILISYIIYHYLLRKYL